MLILSLYKESNKYFFIIKYFKIIKNTCWDLPSTSAEITLPNALKDKLILLASFNLSPVAYVLLYLSDPAKSTKFNLPAVNLWLPFSSSTEH